MRLEGEMTDVIGRQLSFRGQLALAGGTAAVVVAGTALLEYLLVPGFG